MRYAYKQLSINIIMFGISSFGQRIIGFLLVPLYTSYLTTAEYGVADLLNTIVILLIPFFSVDIAEGVMRYVLDKRFKAESVLIIAMRTILSGSIILSVLLLVLYKLPWSNYPFEYYVYIFISFFFQSYYNTIVNYLKGKEHIKDIVIAGILSTLLNATSNILLLTRFNMGIKGYLISYLVSSAFPTLYLFFCAGYHGYLSVCNKKVDRNLKREMITYSAPLILNGLSWWINNSLDRVFVTAICGVSANGILAVSYKIPSILAMLQTIFIQAWSLSVIKEYDSADSNGFIGKVYSYYGCAMTLCSSLIMLCNVFLAELLYANDFFVAWKYTGMLIIANLFGGMSVCISGVFNAVKNTKILAMTTATGALINVILNAILIPWLGVQGAVIATMLSSMIVWLCRMYKVRSYIKLRIRLARDIITYLLVLIQSVAGLVESHLYGFQIMILLCLIILYQDEIRKIFYVSMNGLRRR